MVSTKLTVADIAIQSAVELSPTSRHLSVKGDRKEPRPRIQFRGEASQMIQDIPLDLSLGWSLGYKLQFRFHPGALVVAILRIITAVPYFYTDSLYWLAFSGGIPVLWWVYMRFVRNCRTASDALGLADDIKSGYVSEWFPMWFILVWIPGIALGAGCAVVMERPPYTFFQDIYNPVWEVCGLALMKATGTLAVFGLVFGYIQGWEAPDSCQHMLTKQIARFQHRQFREFETNIIQDITSDINQRLMKLQTSKNLTYFIYIISGAFTISFWVLQPSLIADAYAQGTKGIASLGLMLAYDITVVFHTVYYMSFMFRSVWLRYAQCHLMMEALTRMDLCLTNSKQLFFWREVRKFFMSYEMPINYSLGSWGFVTVFLLDVAFIMIVVVRVLTQGGAIMLSYGQQLLIILCLLLTVFLFVTISKAVSVWNEQQKHICLLKEQIYFIQYASHHVKQDAFNEEKIVPLIQQTIEDIEKYDQPPTVLGLAIKPTLYTVLQGYLVAAVGAILGKILLGS